MLANRLAPDVNSTADRRKSGSARTRPQEGSCEVRWLGSNRCDRPSAGVGLAFEIAQAREPCGGNPQAIAEDA